MIRRTRRSERGLTLTEVLVAMLILSFGLLGAALLFTGSVKTDASSNQLGSANTLAREKIEELVGYPTSDARLLISAGNNAAAPSGTTTTGDGSVVGYNASCDNDLPKWYSPATGATSTAATSPGKGWFRYPYQRTYTVEQYDSDLTTRITTPSGSPAAYSVKKVTVTVKTTTGPFPGLRKSQQTILLRYRDAA